MDGAHNLTTNDKTLVYGQCEPWLKPAKHNAYLLLSFPLSAQQLKAVTTPGLSSFVLPDR